MKIFKICDIILKFGFKVQNYLKILNFYLKFKILKYKYALFEI